MTLKELFETQERIDYDVFNRLTNEVFPGISLPLEISKEGCEKFADALALEAKIFRDPSSCGSNYIMVDVKDESQLKALRSFCYAQAGFTNKENFNKWFKGDEFEISKIVIKGTSGWGPIEEAYHDKVTVTGEGIAYEYHPMMETEINPPRKWSYKTTSPIFKKVYGDLVEVMLVIVNQDQNMFHMYAGGIEFNLTYLDGSKFKGKFNLQRAGMKECLKIIKQMVPETEYIPAVLLTEDDYH